MLQDPAFPYACPIWDKAYIDTAPMDECSIYTLTRISTKMVPMDNRDLDVKLPPSTALQMYYDRIQDPVSRFVRAGVDGTPSTSAASDTRDISMLKYIDGYREKINNILRDNPDRLKYSSEWNYGCAQSFVQPLGYLVLSGEDSHVVAAIIPRFPSPTLDMFYSLDLYYDTVSAGKQFVGQIVSLAFDISGRVPDFAAFIQYITERFSLPSLDPLQEKPANLTEPEWHYLLRKLAVKEPT